MSKRQKIMTEARPFEAAAVDGDCRTDLRRDRIRLEPPKTCCAPVGTASVAQSQRRYRPGQDRRSVPAQSRPLAVAAPLSCRADRPSEPGWREADLLRHHLFRADQRGRRSSVRGRPQAVGTSGPRRASSRRTHDRRAGGCDAASGPGPRCESREHQLSLQLPERGHADPLFHRLERSAGPVFLGTACEPVGRRPRPSSPTIRSIRIRSRSSRRRASSRRQFDPRQLRGKDVVIGTTATRPAIIISSPAREDGRRLCPCNRRGNAEGPARPINLGWIPLLLISLAICGLRTPRRSGAPQPGRCGRAADLRAGALEAYHVYVDVTPALFVLLVVAVA